MTIDELVTIIKFKLDDNSVKKTEAEASSMAGRLGASMKSSFLMFGGMALGAAGIAGMGALVSKAIGATVQLEKLTAQYEVMLGSAIRARQMIQDIQKLAESTPLETMGISESVKQLLAFGVAGDQAIGTIRMLGDVAGGDQQKLSSLAYAFGQTMSAQKLMGQELLQYLNAGFNPLKVMAENTEKFGLKAGTNMSNLRDMMGKGQISAEMVKRSFEIATSEGGLFYQNMEKQALTLGGRWSTLMDNLTLSLIAIVEPLKPLLKDIVEVGITLAKALGEIDVKGFVQFFVEWKGILLVIPGLLLAIYGPAMIARIKAMSVMQGILNHTVDVYGKKILVANTYKQMMIATFARLKVAALSTFTTMTTAVNGTLASVGALIALLGVAYFAYNQILKHEKKAENEIKVDSHRKEVERYSGIDADLAVQMSDKRAILKSDYIKGSRGQAEKAQIEKELADLEFRKTQNKKALGFAQENYEKVREEVDPEYAQDKYEKRMEEERLKAEQTKKELEAQALRDAKANSKQVTNNFNNKINIPLTVDDKGQTQLSAMALDSAMKTAIRSAFNIELIQATEGF